MTTLAREAPAASAAQLSIVIPCLNEAETVGVCVRKALQFLVGSAIAGEVIVADNGSTDGSQAIAAASGARVVAVSRPGYGAALMGGIQAAAGRFVIMGDADDSYDLSDLGAFTGALDGGADLVVGNRFRGGIAEGAMPWLHRYVGNPILSWLGRLLFPCPVDDFHCGLRGFRRQSILALNLRCEGMEYASEMIVRASLAGLRIVEVPTTLAKDGRSRQPHLRTWRDGWRHLRFLLLHSPRWTFAYPGLAIMICGVVGTALLLPGPLSIQPHHSVDVRTFLVTNLMFLVGLQTLTFGVIARRYEDKHRLLPSRARDAWLTRRINLESMLLGSGVLMIGGAAAILWAALYWSRHGFGELHHGAVLRPVIVGASALAGGVQLGFSALLIGVLDLAPDDPADDR